MVTEPETEAPLAGWVSIVPLAKAGAADNRQANTTEEITTRKRVPPQNRTLAVTHHSNGYGVSSKLRARRRGWIGVIPRVRFTYRLLNLGPIRRAKASANQFRIPQAEVRTGNLLRAGYSKSAQLEAKDF